MRHKAQRLHYETDVAAVHTEIKERCRKKTVAFYRHMATMLIYWLDVERQLRPGRA